MLRTLLPPLALASAAFAATPSAAASCAHVEQALEDTLGGDWQVGDDAACVDADDPRRGGRASLTVPGAGLCVGG